MLTRGKSDQFAGSGPRVNFQRSKYLSRRAFHRIQDKVSCMED